MAYDFPASPTNGQIYTPAGGPSYKFQSPVWVMLASGIGEAPVDGQLYGRQNGAWGLVSPLAMPTGAVIDSVFGTYALNADIATLIPADDTIPQISEGVQIVSVSITPKSVTNKLRCRFRGQCSLSALGAASAALFVNSAANAVHAVAVSVTAAAYSHILALEHEFVPGATTLQTLAIRVGPSNNILRMNGQTSGRLFGGVAISTLVVEEIKA